MIRGMIEVADAALGALKRWERRRSTAKWLRETERAFPIGAMVQCLCGRCDPHAYWYVHGYDESAKDLRVVKDPTQLGGAWPCRGESGWLDADPRITKVVKRYDAAQG